MMMSLARAGALALALAAPAAARSPDPRPAAGLRPELAAALAAVDARTDGIVGACASVGSDTRCSNGDRRFSMQSVMKLLVAAAVMDAVDRRGWRLETPVTVRREDLSLYVQPIAELVGDAGYRTTIGDLVERAVVDSDNAATDLLLARLGGPRVVQDLLRRRGIDGVRIDRDERGLQSDIVGVEWRPDYADPKRFEAAVAAVPGAERVAAFERYRRDPRDTATPRGMVAFLRALADGRLLSAPSTEHLLAVMGRTRTGPDRLRGGAPAGWRVAHKTGSSGAWRGLSVATNDVGVLTAPDGTRVAVAVFVGESRAPAAERAGAIAAVARAVGANYRAGKGRPE